MFNILITSNETAWETDQLMRIQKDRFKRYSNGIEAKSVSLDRPDTLKPLEESPALLMYERPNKGATAEIVRYGYLREIRVSGEWIVFRFEEEGRFPRKVVQEFGDRLDLGEWEQNETHWAVKDGGIPKALLDQLQPSYEVVFSFAGEDRKYVEQVADYLRSKAVRVFYDRFEEANLWGKNLAEHFDLIYRQSGQYCVIFVSKHYVEKMWTRHERRSAVARALRERREYVLPARFDDSEVPGIQPTVGDIPLSAKTPVEFGKLILEKLGKNKHK